jgi:hypothetical protein
MAVGKEDVLQVLRDPNLAKINFSLGGLRIDADACRKVAAAIQSGKIGIIQGDDPTWAAYFPEADSIKRGDRTERIPAHSLVIQRTQAFDLNDRALIVHECTHAFLDVTCAVATTKLSSEVSGYMAQVLFLMANGQEPSDEDQTPFGEMLLAVLDRIKEFDLHRREGRGRTLKWKEYEDLRNIVQSLPKYSGVGPMATVAVHGLCS